MRAKFATHPTSGHVTLEYTDADGARHSRTYSTTGRDGRGYVIDVDGKGGSRQVCERLASTGSTLMASRDTLPEVIRREYRAMRRSDARYA